MSLVGPRPLLIEFMPLYNDRTLRRHEVLPGITGWAQVNGRNKISWNTKFELDLFYVENRNFFLDFRILLKTMSAVFRTSEVQRSTKKVMERFNGQN